MLSTVLAGIGLGGLAGGRWFDEPTRAARAATPLALAAGATVLLGYAGFGFLLKTVLPPGRAAAQLVHVVALTAPLVLPTAFLSGLLFTALAGAARERVSGDGEATGYLVLANTLGAAVGSALAGFVLLPRLGLEGALLTGAAAYVVTAGLAWRRADVAPRWAVLAAVPLLAGGALFPVGSHLDRLAHPHAVYHEPGSRVKRVLEGPLETLVLLENQRLGELHHHRILSNAFSQAADYYVARRYMRAFVHLPVALHPEPRRALLVSYGIGTTARALVETDSLESIDVVDISAEILSLASQVHRPSENPLLDPRVRVFVEDGRFFLRTGAGQYDLITSEPSPPKLTGVVNLFTREYFGLLRDHLAPGGFVSYWLPIHDLSEADAKAVVGAFCGVFADCTAWATSGLDWMLLGSHGDAASTQTADFARQWSEPAVASELAAIGFERPEQLLATFVAGASDLAELAGEVPPLVDDFPLRLSHEPILPTAVAGSPLVQELLDPDHARAAFLRSAFARRQLGPGLREAALPWFEWEGLAQARIAGHRAAPLTEPDLVKLLRGTSLQTLPLWLLGSDVREQGIAARLRADGKGVSMAHGVGALAGRRYAEAARHFAAVRRTPRARALQTLSSCLAGEAEAASVALQEFERRYPKAARQPRFRQTLERECGLPAGAGRGPGLP